MANKPKHLKPTEESMKAKGQEIANREYETEALVVSAAKESEASMGRLYDEAARVRETQQVVKGSFSVLTENLGEKPLAFMEGFLTKGGIDKAFNDMQEALILYEIKRRKLYRDAGFKNFSEYCGSRGISRGKGYEWAQYVEDLGPDDFSVLTEKVGMNQSFFRAFSLLPKQIQEAVILEGDLTVNGKPVDFSGGGEQIKQLVLGLATELNGEKKARKDEKGEAERMLRQKDTLINTQSRALSKLEKIATEKGLAVEEDAFITKMENIKKQFDMVFGMNLDPLNMVELSPPVADEDEQKDGQKKKNKDKAPQFEPTKRMKAAYLTTLSYMKMQILAYYDTAVDYHGDPTMCPENAWKQPE